jgi:hypothetical protein
MIVELLILASINFAHLINSQVKHTGKGIGEKQVYGRLFLTTVISGLR